MFYLIKTFVLEFDCFWIYSSSKK